MFLKHYPKFESAEPFTCVIGVSVLFSLLKNLNEYKNICEQQNESLIWYKAALSILLIYRSRLAINSHGGCHAIKNRFSHNKSLENRRENAGAFPASQLQGYAAKSRRGLK